MLESCLATDHLDRDKDGETADLTDITLTLFSRVKKHCEKGAQNLDEDF